jgi:hypothetical protein
MDNPRADPLAHRRVAIRVQNNFYPILSTKLYEQSGNTVHDRMLGNLELCGNLVVRQADRDEAYQLLVARGQLRCLLILHIAPKKSPHLSVREDSPCRNCTPDSRKWSGLPGSISLVPLADLRRNQNLSVLDVRLIGKPGLILIGKPGLMPSWSLYAYHLFENMTTDWLRFAKSVHEQDCVPDRAS